MPIDLPISGSFFGPKTRRATTKIKSSSGIPMDPNMFPPAWAILRRMRRKPTTFPAGMSECNPRRLGTGGSRVTKPRSRFLTAIGPSRRRHPRGRRRRRQGRVRGQGQSLPGRVRGHPDDPLGVGAGAGRAGEVRLRLDPRNAVAPRSPHGVPGAGRILRHEGKAAGLLLRSGHPDSEEDGQDHGDRPDGGDSGLQDGSPRRETSSSPSKTRRSRRTFRRTMSSASCAAPRALRSPSRSAARASTSRSG